MIALDESCPIRAFDPSKFAGEPDARNSEQVTGVERHAFFTVDENEKGSVVVEPKPGRPKDPQAHKPVEAVRGPSLIDHLHFRVATVVTPYRKETVNKMAETTGWTEDNEIDLGGVSEDMPPPPDDGIYKFTVTKATPQPTKTGKPMTKLVLKFEERHGGGEIGRSSNVFTQLTFNGEPALRQLKQMVRATGVPAPKSTSAENVRDYCDRLVGSTGWCVHGTKLLGSRKFSDIKRFLATEQVEAAANGETELESVGAVNGNGNGKRRR